MNHTARQYRHKNPPIIDIHFAPEIGVPLIDQKPDLRCTRILQLAAPADDQSPAYSCIMVELYDGDPSQRDRPKIVIDESIGLDPAEFTEEERDRYGIHTNEVKHPTLSGFRRGAVALKDLYRPQLMLCPGKVSSPEGPNYEKEYIANKFYRHLVTTDGLMQYYTSATQGDYYNWFPFIDRRAVEGDWPTVGVTCVEEDAEFDRRIVDNLMARDKLQIAQICKGWHENRTQWTAVKRAITLGCVWLQDNDITFQIRDWEAKERGYDDVTDQRRKEQVEQEALLDAEIMDVAYLTGAQEVDEAQDYLDREIGLF